MVRRVQKVLEDDLDGSRAAETVSFALDGQHYEIDLSRRNATQLRSAVATYTSSARRRRRTITSRRRSAAPTEVSDIRAWAADNGYELSNRGRIPAKVRQAYSDATG